MCLTNSGDPNDPAASAILSVQRETLTKFGMELLDQQHAAMARMQADMDRTVVELNDRLTTWRRRLISTMRVTTVLLVPWLVAVGLLAATTLLLGIKAREAWGEYRAAANAAERMRRHGAVTVLKDGELYVRIDRASIFQGSHGNWYARAPQLVFRRDEPTSADLQAR